MRWRHVLRVRHATCWWTWTSSPPPVPSSSHESVSWLVQQRSAQAEVSLCASVSPSSESISGRLFTGAHTLLTGVEPEVCWRGVLSGGAQIWNCSGRQQSLLLISWPWTDLFLRFHRERNSPHQWQKKKTLLAANAQSSHFAAYRQLNFTPFHSEMDLGFLPSIFPASKSRLVCWNKK